MRKTGCPVDIKIFSKAELSEDLERLIADGKKTLFLITDSRIRAFGMEDSLSRWLKNPSVRHYAKIEPNPSIASLTEALNAVREFSPERIIAFGGGSSIDTAKGLSALLPLGAGSFTEDFVREAISSKQYLGSAAACKILAVPTTAGSGSDVTHWATIWDPEHGRKLSVDKPELYPEASLLCAELQAGMPRRLTLSTGLDALSHAMEAFWSRARNPESQQYAMDAVSGIAEDLPKVLDDPSNLSRREAMMMHALNAGIAFSSTRTTACHSISYPLTMRYGIEHGFACALSLFPVAKRNLAAVPEIQHLLEPFGGLEGFGVWLQVVSTGIQPLKLSSWNVPETDLPRIAVDAFTKGRMDNNPIAFSEADVMGILRESL